MTLTELHNKGRIAANEAAIAANAKLGDERSRGFDCGFAWIHAPTVRPNTNAGKELMALGFDRHYKAGVQLWYSKLHDVPTQSISVHIAAVQAYAEVMKSNALGIRFETGSRYD